MFAYSLYFLLKICKNVRIKKILNAYVQPVAELFNCGNGCAVVSSACYIVERGLRNPA